MTSNVKTDLGLTGDQVEYYLKNNPTFFLDRDQLLTELYLPHASGDAVSLLERQVCLLRERNIESRKRLNKFVSRARDNDELFDKTQTIILTMIDAKSLVELIDEFIHYVLTAFHVDIVEVTLLSDDYTPTRNFPKISHDAAIEHLPWLTSIKDCISGHFRDQELKVLFRGRTLPASAIVFPLHHKQDLIALVCFGSNDSHYFKANMDTLFIEFITAVLSRCIGRFKNSS